MLNDITLTAILRNTAPQNSCTVSCRAISSVSVYLGRLHSPPDASNRRSHAKVILASPWLSPLPQQIREAYILIPSIYEVNKLIARLGFRHSPSSTRSSLLSLLPLPPGHPTPCPPRFLSLPTLQALRDPAEWDRWMLVGIGGSGCRAPGNSVVLVDRRRSPAL